MTANLFQASDTDGEPFGNFRGDSLYTAFEVPDSRRIGGLRSEGLSDPVRRAHAISTPGMRTVMVWAGNVSASR
jgi:hypothetical protein